MSTDLSDAAGQSQCYKFNSDEVLPKDRYSYWEDVVCARLSPSENVLLSQPDQFSAKILCNTVGTVDVCRLQSSPLRYVRSAKMISRMPNDDIFIAVIERGSGYIEQYGRQAICSVDDIVVYDSGNTFSWNLAETTQMMVAMIPRVNFGFLLPKLKTMITQPIRPENGISSLIRSNISEMLRLKQNTSSECTRRLGNSFSDVISSALEIAYFDGNDSSKNARLTQRAKRYMRDNIEDPGLDFDSVVRHVGASRRTLARAFASEGTTAIKWLWEERLTHAFSLLQRSDVKNVSQAVMRSGFNDFSHFTRSFKKKYGLLPKAVLKQGPMKYDLEEH